MDHLHYVLVASLGLELGLDCWTGGGELTRGEDEPGWQGPPERGIMSVTWLITISIGQGGRR